MRLDTPRLGWNGGRQAADRHREHQFGPSVEDHVDTDKQTDRPEAGGRPRAPERKAQRDQIRLSTAYRADQLLADIVKGAMRASAEDLARVQAAARDGHGRFSGGGDPRRGGAAIVVDAG